MCRLSAGFGHSSGARPGFFFTQPPHVTLYQAQLPGQKSDKRSFHSDRFFRKSLRGKVGDVGINSSNITKAGSREAAQVDEIMNATDFLSGAD